MTVTEISEARTLKPAEMTGKTWRIKIIEGDRQGSSAYYPKEAVEAGKHLFGKGVRSFKNHPSADEKWNRPERDIDDIIGHISEAAEYDGKDLWASLTIIESQRARIKELAEAGLIDISIRASGEMVEGTNGMELKKFVAVHSVDIVTQGGAGGKFGEVLESARPKVSASESGAESLEEKESIMDPKLEAALDALVESAKANTATLKTLTERAAKEDKEKADLAEAARLEAEKKDKPAPVDPLAVVAKLAEAKLAPAAQARVLEAVKGGKELAEAITAEQAYVKAIQEAAPEFKGNGSEELQEAAGSKIGTSIYGV